MAVAGASGRGRDRSVGGCAMTWTQFWDMHSGGGLKEKQARIYIEAPEAEAKVIFFNRFGHNPERVTCTCCGDDYSISESLSLGQASGFHRNCPSLETPRRADGRYQKVEDPWFKAHYYLEPDEVAEAEARGWSVKDNLFSSLRGHDYQTIEEYIAQDDVLVIRADEIQPEWRKGDAPDEGYVWVGAPQ